MCSSLKRVQPGQLTASLKEFKNTYKEPTGSSAALEAKVIQNIKISFINRLFLRSRIRKKIFTKKTLKIKEFK